jgi:hypothetical protein
MQQLPNIVLPDLGYSQGLVAAGFFTESGLTLSLRARARTHAREIIEEFSLEMPQRLLPEKCQWR